MFAMLLTCIPTELLEDIAGYLTPRDISALVATSKQLYHALMSKLYRLARNYIRKSDASLTEGLHTVSFWFDKRGNGTVLEWAATHNYLSLFKRLLMEPGIDILQNDGYRVTLLHRLSGQGMVRFMGPLIEAIKKKGLDPFSLDLSSLTPLHFAAGRGMVGAVELLIACGSDVSAKDHHGNMPLHLAAVTGSDTVFAPLIKAGANINSETRFGWAAIDQASITHHSRAVDELIALGSRPPSWAHKRYALNEYVRLSPCPLEYYFQNVEF